MRVGGTTPAALLYSIALAPLIRRAHVSLEEAVQREPPLGLVICTNTNICGKRNPGMAQDGAGYGYAFRAIECLRVCGPENLVVQPGPCALSARIDPETLPPNAVILLRSPKGPFARVCRCFIRCSAGVNAKLVLPQGGAMHLRERYLKDGCPYYRLNSIALCVEWLNSTLAWEPAPDVLTAYSHYAEACTLLDDSIQGPLRGDIELNISPMPSASRASEALPLLDVACEYVLGLPPPQEGWPPTPAAQRGTSFCATRWRESFYGTELCLDAEGGGGEASGGEASGSEASGGEGGGAGFGGGSADEAEAALDAARASLGSRGYAAVPAASRRAFYEGELRGTYGGGRCGVIRGVQSGDTLRGRWQEGGEGGGEGGEGGEMVLRVSPDGLTFEGLTSAGDAWTGERLSERGSEVRGTPIQRWRARTLSLRSRAHLALGRADDAIRDAACAVRTCPWLPLAWEVAAESALQLQDTRTAARALTELLYLQPASAELPLPLANKRRLQRLTLDKIGAGDLAGSGMSSNPLSLYLMLGDFDAAATQQRQQRQPPPPTQPQSPQELKPPQPPSQRAEQRAEQAAWEGLFADEYAVVEGSADPDAPPAS